MDLNQTLGVLRSVAPEGLAESWDKAGLQLGELGQPIRSAMLCIDLTEPVLAEAIAAGVELIVAYHPPIFKPLDAVTEADVKPRIILKAARAGLAVYSPHTALDAATGGTNDYLANGLGTGTRRPITPIDAVDEVKLVVFVPPNSAEAVRARLSEAGAGVIGDYDRCSFGHPGRGTFRGNESTHPAVGEAGRFETVEELRMEMVCPKPQLAGAIDALCDAHPYEEPAYDILPLIRSPRRPAPVQGAGRVVELDEPVSLRDLAERVKRQLGVSHLEVGAAEGVDPHAAVIHRVGLCVGAGGSLRGQAGKIDAFITGEMRHHDQLDAVAHGCSLLLAGHTQTERPYLSEYRRRLIEAGGAEIDWRISEADHAPTTPG